MCGIVGTLNFRGRADLDLVMRQRDAMHHRGPDSCGAWGSEDGRVAFGHRRLAIIDLSPGGHQPMHDPSSGNVITFNGEIYNYVELRDRLRGLGHTFHSQSDTEVVLAAYRAWGPACLEQLEGMFALALYDHARARVLIARDRAGEKPLFYAQVGDRLLFASEIKALLLDDAVPRQVRASGINEYLAYGYNGGESTIFAGIRRVPAGGRLIADLHAGTVVADRYWTLPSADPSVASHVPTPEETEALVDELHGLLRRAVGRQLVADVPVGVLLSGGVDSSLIAAIATEVSSASIRTFTARFPGHAGFDEGPFARLVAEHLGAEHVELETEPASSDLLLSLVRQFDDPVADSSMLPTYLVSREIRKHATVAIGGDGGDELFGGYRQYPIQVRQQELRGQVPSMVRRAAARAAEALLPVGTRGRGFAMALDDDAGAGIANTGRIFRHDERASLVPSLATLPAAALTAPEAHRRALLAERTSTVGRATAVDFSLYMVDDVLVKVDRASMLCSLEVRAPFLDPHVIEFAFGRLPDALRATRSARKVILRHLGARLLPPALDLKRKQGFDIPLDDWMRGAWRPLLDDVASRPSVLIAPGAIARYRAQLDAGRPVGERLFALLALVLWEREYGITDVVA